MGANPVIDPSSNLAPLNAIHGIVTAIPAYYPITIAVSCADARWDAGDFVTITDTDNNSITVPIMHQAMEWNGMCHATLSATGKQVRDIPESMLNTDLSSMVDSNPSAVVNKIEAHGISADWITSGTIDEDVINLTNVTAEKVLVKDASNHTLLDSDAAAKSVMIAGFDVEDSGMTKTQGTVTTEISSDGYIDLEDNDPAQPSRTRLDTTGLSVEDSLLGDATSVQPGAIYLTSSPDSATLMSDRVRVSNSSNSTTQTATGITADNGTESTTQSATGVTFDDGTATSKMSVIKRTMDSAGTTTVTLQRGAYLAIVTHTNNTTAGQQGLYLIQAYDSNSVVTTITAAANSTLTVSGLTLTWTTTNTYRALRLIYLS